MSNGSRDQETEFFHKAEKEKLRRLKEQQEADKITEAARKLREAHFHHCGKCGNKMDTQVFKGVEIEVCPACGSVLLDPGELEQLAGKDKSSSFGVLTDLFKFGGK